ncbi:uncharacterized protein LOC124491306 isoform X1 [Dermatophagoides farinae]|uniref:uncharacterized protein LOC124491306 isoform X1 n=1 Tax=Dermatophagoides farinae TaxID=6954 RepID=UPI003F5FD503
MNRNFIPIFGYLIIIIITSTAFATDNDGGQNKNNVNNNNLSSDNDKQNETEINQLSLAYGLLLDTNCETDDDCIIKNSICNTNTKRCDCDFNAIQSDNRCRTLHCRTSQDCSSHFGNTICVFGTCRCRWGLKANGKCVDLDVPGIGQQSLPDWAISLIAIAALLSGIWGGRSPFISQLSRQLLSILILILGRFAAQQSNQQNNGQQQQSPPLLIDELQSAMMIQFNQPINSNSNDNENDDQSKQQQQQQQQNKPKLSSASILDELLVSSSSLVQPEQKQ